MYAGNIATWQKKEGDAVAAGDEIADIETDKATMGWEAQDEGFIAKILAGDGSKDIAVGDPVMVFVEEQVYTQFDTWPWTTCSRLLLLMGPS